MFKAIRGGLGGRSSPAAIGGMRNNKSDRNKALIPAGNSNILAGTQPYTTDPVLGKVRESKVISGQHRKPARRYSIHYIYLPPNYTLQIRN